MIVSVAVVTDSTAYFPDGAAERAGIRQVPLHVLVDDRHWLDGVQLGPAELVVALVRRASVTTSRPSPGEFETVYLEAIRAGADAVVSVHLSRLLSGTWESARMAAEQVDPERVGALAQAFFSVDSLEYLRRGGRLSQAAARLGSALAVKPLLRVDAGRVMPLEKVRTGTRARARLVELALRAARSSPCAAAVHHLGAAEHAADLAAQLRVRLPRPSECMLSEVGAAIGAHAGPGMLGVVVVPGGITAPR